MKIGLSFFWQVILGINDPNKAESWQLAIPDITDSLLRLKTIGINSIELKLTDNMDVHQLFEAIRSLIQEGFGVTLHASGRFRYPEDLSHHLENFSTISKLVNNDFNLVPLWIIHPLNSKTKQRSEIFAQTVDYLQQILTAMAEIPACFALEILRNRADSGKIHIGDSYPEILDILSNFDDENLGICWDFGHANAMYQRGLQEQFPPQEFLNKVIHCHVHDCRDQKTHLPLGMGEVPIEKNIQLLFQNNFDGILNLELAPHRIDDPANFVDHVARSVKIIQNFIGQMSAGY